MQTGDLIESKFFKHSKRDCNYLQCLNSMSLLDLSMCESALQCHNAEPQLWF
jgi:hypothetical protein